MTERIVTALFFIIVTLIHVFNQLLNLSNLKRMFVLFLLPILMFVFCIFIQLEQRGKLQKEIAKDVSTTFHFSYTVYFYTLKLIWQFNYNFIIHNQLFVLINCSVLILCRVC